MIKLLKKIKRKFLLYFSFFMYPIYLLINNYRYKKYHLNILSNQEIIDKIKNEHISISRYGDGEFSMILNKTYSIGFQRANSILSNRLEEILKNYDNSNSKHMIGVIGVLNPNELSKYKKHVRVFWTDYIFRKFNILKKYLKRECVYFDSLLTRCYMDYEDKSGTEKRYVDLKSIWDDKDIIIIEGDKTKMGIGNDLFDNARSIKRIICPSNDAFSKYDDILSQAKQICKNKLTLVALGPTATVLSYDLCSLNPSDYQVLDLGHMDIEYEWYRLGAEKKVAINGKAVNEVKSIDLSNNSIDDKKYLSQIVKIIK